MSIPPTFPNKPSKFEENTIHLVEAPSEPDVKNTLPKTLKGSSKEIDVIELKEAVDELISIKENKNKSGLALRMVLGFTVGVLCLPLTLTAGALGLVLGAGIGAIKHRLLWDYEYDKMQKTQPMYILMFNVGVLRPIHEDAWKGAEFLSYFPLIGFHIGAEALDKLYQDCLEEENEDKI